MDAAVKADIAETAQWLLERATAFAARLDAVVRGREDSLELCHVRDPWSAMGVLGSRTGRRFRFVYEVNGLPSIELPARYPLAGPRTVAKIAAMEDECLDEAAWVVTPSHTIARYLHSRGCAPEKITVIPNGADPDPTVIAPIGPPPRYIAYVGGVQRWQGIDTLLRAFARLADLGDVELVIVSAAHRRTLKPYLRLADRLDISSRLRWISGAERAEVAGWLAGAAMSVAPLTASPRNVVQGCAPLKILESMAVGTPVVASDLPAVREIVTDGVHGRLVAPDRPAELARAMRILLEHPHRAHELGAAARDRLVEHFTWDRACEALAAGYRRLVPDLPDRVSRLA
jgi:glycosyltransferase involved in cell wall biosynthesis